MRRRVSRLRRRIRGQSSSLFPDQFAAQGFFAAQGLHGFFAAQGLHGFFAAQGLHGFLAAQGLAQQGLQGFFAQAEQGLHGLAPAAIDAPGTAMAMAATATPAARTVLNLLSLIGIGFLSSQNVETDRVVSLLERQ